MTLNRVLGAALFLFSSTTASPFHRDEEPRSMTWSNFMPGGGGMTLFTSGIETQPWSDLTPPLPKNDRRYWGEPEGLTPPKDIGTELDESSHLTPPKGKPFDDNRGRRKPWSWRNSDDDDVPAYSGSKASVNAWFPIMFGMMPPNSSDSPASAASGKSSRTETTVKDPSSLSAVANSVNYATRGLASSHAVLYTGDPPASLKKFL